MSTGAFASALQLNLPLINISMFAKTFVLLTPRFVRPFVLGMVGLAALLTSGCITSSHMSPVAGNTALPIEPGKAQIVFMRPSSYGGAIQSSVYHLNNGKEEFIGIVSTGTKVAYNVPPGEQLFMVVAENADFMIAHMLPNKTYYALVSPRIGMWKARFSLLPIHNDPAAKYNLNGEEFIKWMASTKFVELAASGRTWYQENAASVAEKRADYLVKWNRMLPEDKASLILHEKDGVPAASSN